MKAKKSTYRQTVSTFSVGAPGFEPGTPCSQSRCATGLRYAPKNQRWRRRNEDDARCKKTGGG